VEENKDEQEASGRRGGQEGQRGYPRSRKEYGNEWTRSRTFGSLPLRPFTPVSVFVTTLDRESNRVFFPQFAFNPEWFEEEEEEEEDWDLDKYRKQKEAEDEAAEVERIRQLQIEDGGGE